MATATAALLARTSDAVQTVNLMAIGRTATSDQSHCRIRFKWER
jgi:hypothetical protein